MSKKAQTAVEFLTTYGWVILGVIILLAILTYYGAFNPLRFVPRQCTFEPGLPCTTNKLEVNQTTIRLITQLSNDLGYDIALPENALLLNAENLGKSGKYTYIGNCSPRLPYVIKKGGTFTCIVEITDKELIPEVGKNIRLQTQLTYKNCLTDPNYLATGNCTSAANYTSTGTEVTPMESYSRTLYCGDGICSASIGENPSTCPLDCPLPIALLLTANPATVAPDGNSYSTINATLFGVSGRLPNVEVVFISTPIGKLSRISAMTNPSGVATVQLSSDIPGIAKVTAVAYIANTTNVTFSSVPASIKLTASDYYPPICGFDSVITATVKDQGGNAVGDMDVNFSHTSKDPNTQLEPRYGITDERGQTTSRFFNDGTLETLQVTGNLTVPESGYILSDTITLSTSNCSCQAPPSGIWAVNRRVICSNQSITLNGNLTIVNGGDLIFLGNVTLNMNGYSIRVNCGGSFRIWDTDSNPQTTNDRSIILGSAAMGPSFIVDPCGKFEMLNSELSGIYTQGIYNGRCSQDNVGLVISGNGTRIINSTILDSHEGVTFMNSFNNTISGNVISSTGFAGVNLINTTDTVIYNNSFPNTGVGVCLSNSHRNKIDKNFLPLSRVRERYYSGGGGGGLYADGSTYNNITNNIVPSAENCEFTFTFTNSHHNLIENNSLAYCPSGAYGTGVKMDSSNFNTINNNRFNNVGYYGSRGIALTNGSSNIVSNNLINNTIWEGITITGGSGNRVENNSVRDNGVGINVSNSPSTIIFNNKAISNKFGIALESSASSQILNNNASDNHNGHVDWGHGKGVYVSHSNDVIVDGNYVSNNGFIVPGVGKVGSGIELSSSNGCIVRNNTAVNNIANGIYSVSSMNILIEKNNVSGNGPPLPGGFCTVDWCYGGGIRFSASGSTAKAANNTVINNDYGFYCINSQPTLQDNYAANNTKGDWDSCPSPGGDAVNLCKTITTSSVLIADLVNSSTCITFGADGIILDCNGHSITGMKTTNTYGVYAGSRKNIVIKNCVIKNYSVGIELNFTSQSDVFNNTIYNNSKEGIYLFQSGENDVNTNNIYNNERGIRVYLANSNNIYSNTVYNSTILEGIVLYSANQTGIHNNVIYNNLGGGTAGIYVNRGSYDEIYGNNISKNYVGIQLDSSSTYNQVHDNTVYNNTASGILITSSNSNTFSSNNVTNNNVGMYFSSSGGNVSLNTVTLNPSYGVQCVGSPKPTIFGNTIVGNGNDTDDCPIQTVMQISSCGTITTNSILTTNLTASDTCITFGADNITLDCNGHSITGTDAFNSLGVYAASRKNILIKNCRISHYAAGIYLNNNNYSSIFNNTIFDNLQLAAVGIQLDFGSGNKIYNNTVYTLNGGGINVFLLLNASIYNNTIHNAAPGMEVNQANDTKVYNNTVYDTGLEAMRVFSCNGVEILENILGPNNYGGAYFDKVSGGEYNINVTFKSNIIKSNLEFGVRCYGSPPIFISNTISDNPDDCDACTGCLTGTSQPLYSCGTITENSTLMADLTNSSTCITFGADNIYLDCAGHSITGPQVTDPSTDGIYAQSKKNITIRNCNLFGFKYQIHLVNVTNAKVNNNTLSGNELIGTRGVYLENSSYNTLSNNTAYNNNENILLEAANYNTISQNLLLGAVGGIDLQDSSYNLIKGNTCMPPVAGYGVIGIGVSKLISTCTSNNVSGNTVTLTAAMKYENTWGIVSGGCDNTLVENNNVSLTGTGLVLLVSTTPPPTIRNNSIFDNTNGIYVSLGGNPIITKNNITNNDAFGVKCDSGTSPTFSGNTISGNGNDCDDCTGCQSTMQQISSCGTITTNSILTTNLTASDTCITFGANNIVLDCNGHSIRGPGIGTSDSYGIYAQSKKNITVKNCNVTYFPKPPIKFLNVTNSKIMNNIVSDGHQGAFADIHLNLSVNNLIFNNTCYDSTGEGLRLDNSNYTNISQNTFMSMDFGNFLRNSHYNQIYNNTYTTVGFTSQCIMIGVHIEDSVGNNISKNNITGVPSWKFTVGISVDSCNDTRIEENKIAQVSQYGIWIFGGEDSNNLLISKNEIRDSAYGVRCEACVTPIFSGNVYINDSIDCHSPLCGLYCADHCHDP